MQPDDNDYGDWEGSLAKMEDNGNEAFERGTGAWEGVVIIVRPPAADSNSLCRVASARTVEFNGRRAIAPFEVPYTMVRHLFQSADDAETYAWAEFYPRPNNQPGHIEFFERASQTEFFITAGGAKRMYPAKTRVV